MGVKEVYAARKKLQEEGIWCVIPGGKVKIKPARGNDALLKKIELFDEDASEDVMFNDLVDAVATDVMLDWEGFDTEYSKETFIETCTDLRDCGLLQDIVGLVMDKEMLDNVAIAKAAKN